VASRDKKKRPMTSPQTESGRAPTPIEPTARLASLDDESREDFVVRGSVVETPEGYKLRF
jgi:hypothetical protein